MMRSLPARARQFPGKSSDGQRRQGCGMDQGEDSAQEGQADPDACQFLLLFWRAVAVPHPAAVGYGAVHVVLLRSGTRQGLAEHRGVEQRCGPGMAIQEPASLDLDPAAGDSVFPHDHRVLPQGLPEPQAFHLADRRVPAAPGVPSGRHRTGASLGLEILLVLRDVARLCGHLGLGRANQELAA